MGLARVWRALSDQYGKMLLVLVLILAGVVLALTPPLIIKGIVDNALANKDVNLLIQLIVTYVAVSFITSLVGIIQTYTLLTLSVSVTANLQRRIFRALQAASARFYHKMKPGDIMARFQSDATALQGVTQMLSMLLNSALGGIGALLVLFAMDWPLALICVCSYFIYFIPLRPLGRKVGSLTKDRQRIYGGLIDWLHQSMEGIRLIKTFGAENHAVDMYESRLTSFFHFQLRAAVVWRLVRVWSGIVSSLGPAAAFWYGGRQFFAGHITLGVLIAFTAYLDRLFGMAQSLAFGYVQIKEIMPRLDRVEEVISEAERELDPTGEIVLTETRGEIEFRNVRFSYRSDVPVLQDVSFRIEPGQRVAFVGPTGSGKSTILSLILRLYDPDHGSVLADRTDLQRIDPQSWRRLTAFVPQEPFLFHTSLSANIRYGTEAGEAEMIDAARQAAIHEFIAAQEAGYETVVGERGVQLSGGQRQRVVLARALLRNPRILLLDEATSALDNENEAAVEMALNRASSGRTTIVVAHRLSTVVDCDVIYVLDRGRIVEQGMHADLLRMGGLYARMSKAETKEAEPSGAADAK